MYSLRTLEIVGYRNEPVPNTFFQENNEASHAAILLPGIGYTCQMPLLYYPTLLLQSRGTDVLQVEYAYNRRPDFQTLSNSERERWLFTDVTAVYHALLAHSDYQQLTIIGKSLGTLAMSHLLTTEAISANSKAIWLTPLLRNEWLRNKIQQWGRRSLFVIGTADPHYDLKYLTDVQRATNSEAIVIENADHSLVVNNDLFQSLRAIEQIMHAVQRFLFEE